MLDDGALTGGHRTGIIAEFSPTDPRTEGYTTGRIC